MTTRFSNLDGRTRNDHPTGSFPEDNATVLDAVDRSRRIISAARADAEKLLAEARKVSEAERTKAYEEGLACAREELAEELLGVQAMRRENVLSQEKVILDVACAVAEEVIGDAICEQPESILKRVKRVLREVVHASQATLAVCPEDAEFVRGHLGELRESLQTPFEIAVREEKSLGRGNCRLETDISILEGSLSSHLTAIKNHLMRTRGLAAPQNL